MPRSLEMDGTFPFRHTHEYTFHLYPSCYRESSCDWSEDRRASKNGGGIIVQPQYTLLELFHAEALGEVFSYLNRLNPELHKVLFGGRHFRLHG
jgi:hypothetical protein